MKNITTPAMIRITKDFEDFLISSSLEPKIALKKSIIPNIIMTIGINIFTILTICPINCKGAFNLVHVSVVGSGSTLGGLVCSSLFPVESSAFQELLSHFDLDCNNMFLLLQGLLLHLKRFYYYCK